MTAREYNIIVKDYSDNAYRFACSLVGDRTSAQDIVQDVFVKLWEEKDKVQTAKVKSWIFSSVHNKAIDELRKQKNNVGVEQINQVCYNEYSSLQEELNAYLKQLPVVQQSVILLKDAEGYKYEEISEILHLSTEQVKVYLFRARKRLQSLIKDKGNLM